MIEKPRIAVAGNMGSGKTSFTGWLSEEFGLRPFYEPQDENPFLADFYKDMCRWVLSSQTFFLVSRHRIHMATDDALRSHDVAGTVQDRTMWEDAEVFARSHYLSGIMDQRSWSLYKFLYDSLRLGITPPSLMVFLKCSVPELQRRIAQRGRAYESAVPTQYLEALDSAYREWIESYDLSPVLVVDTESFDCRKRPHADALARAVARQLGPESVDRLVLSQ